MKRSLLLLIIATTSLVACNDNATQTPAAEEPAKQDSTVITQPLIAERCYALRSAKDTVLLHLTIADSIVTGELSYQYFEKDRNKGAISGTMKGDTLLANYTFQSEGTQSVRQVTFIIQDSSATEGYGPIEEKNGQQSFTNLKAIKFSGKPLVRSSCKP